jgi:hypothetical protein
MPNDPRFPPENPLPWWTANGPLRITVRPYASASGSANNPDPADGIDDWIVPSNRSDGSSDGNDWSFPAPTTPDSAPYAPNAWAGSTDASSVNPFALPLFESFPSAPYPSARVQPLISPAVSSAVAWGLPIFPQDILGFDPNKIPASEWPTESPIFLRGLPGAPSGNVPPSTWSAPPAFSQAPDPQSAPTVSLLPGVLPDGLLSRPRDPPSIGILPYSFDTQGAPSTVSIPDGPSGSSPLGFERFVHPAWPSIPSSLAWAAGMQAPAGEPTPPDTSSPPPVPYSPDGSTGGRPATQSSAFDLVPSLPAASAALPDESGPSELAAAHEPAAGELGPTAWPTSKATGAPFAPPPTPPSISGAQWQGLAKLVGDAVAPNLTDYLTKPNPALVYPSAPGKMPEVDSNHTLRVRCQMPPIWQAPCRRRHRARWRARARRRNCWLRAQDSSEGEERDHRN